MCCEMWFPASQYFVIVTHFLTLTSNTMYQQRVLMKFHCYTMWKLPSLRLSGLKNVALHPLNLLIFSYTFSFLSSLFLLVQALAQVLVPVFVLK